MQKKPKTRKVRFLNPFRLFGLKLILNDSSAIFVGVTALLTMWLTIVAISTCIFILASASTTACSGMASTLLNIL